MKAPTNVSELRNQLNKISPHVAQLSQQPLRELLKLSMTWLWTAQHDTN